MGGPNGGLQNEVNAFNEAGYSINDDKHIQVLGDSKEIHTEISERIDLLFVDGDHAYKSCYNDLAIYWQKVKKGGIIAVHDYCSIMWGDVQKATDEFFSEVNAELIGHIDTIIAYRKK